jgi:hypothetical protein
MSNRQAELEGLTIVVVGSFNPAIFHPAWFSRCNLIRQEEADSAKVEIVHSEVAQFSGDWFSVQRTSGPIPRPPAI